MIPDVNLSSSFHSVAIGVSFNIICLLNGFQIIKLNPSIWRWMELKIRSLTCVAFCCSLCWILHLLINSCVPMVVQGSLKGKNFSVNNNYGYRSSHMKGGVLDLLTAVTYISPHFLSLGFMVSASGSLVLVLHRHKQQVQYICSNWLSPRPSHEARATHTILVLMSSFVTFYSAYIILIIWMILATNWGPWMVNISVFLASSFPVFFPFVLIISDAHMSQLCFACRASKSVS